MVTLARITEDIASAGLDWITGNAHRRSGRYWTVVPCSSRCSISVPWRASSHPPSPTSARWFARNRDLAAERTHQRQDLLAATEREHARIQAAVARRRDPLRGTAAIGLADSAVINKYKVATHFDLNIADTAFSFARKTAEIAAEAAVDGVYVIRTSLAGLEF